MGNVVVCIPKPEKHERMFKCVTCAKCVHTSVESRYQMGLCAECETDLWPRDVYVRGSVLYNQRLEELVRENPGELRTPLMVATEHTDEKIMIRLLTGVGGAPPVDVDDDGSVGQSALVRLIADARSNLLLTDDERFRLICIPRRERLRIGALLVF
jgi:hypothetical protein